VSPPGRSPVTVGTGPSLTVHGRCPAGRGRGAEPRLVLAAGAGSRACGRSACGKPVRARRG